MNELRAGRAAIFALVGWLGMLAAGSIASVIRIWRIPPPDVGLTVVLYLSLTAQGSSPAVGAVAVVLGYCSDLVGGAPKGTHMIAYLAVALVARAVAWRLLLRGPLVVAAVVAVFATFADAILVLLRVSSGAGWGALRDLPLLVLSTALFAAAAFPLLARVARVDRSAPRTQAQLGTAR